MDEDEEMKIQCFGGDYMGEVFFIYYLLLIVFNLIPINLGF